MVASSVWFSNIQFCCVMLR